MQGIPGGLRHTSSEAALAITALFCPTTSRGCLDFVSAILFIALLLAKVAPLAWNTHKFVFHSQLGVCRRGQR